MISQRLLAAVALCLWSLIGALGVDIQAAHAAPPAEAFLQSQQQALADLVRGPVAKGRDAKILGIFDELLDYDALARESLGRHWDGLDDKQRSEFSSVLRQLVQRAYERNIKKTVDYRISYRGQTAADAAVLVKTVAVSEKNARQQPVSIDYLMRKVAGRWKVQDIVTEGSSMVRSYRRQFSRVIAKKGFDELLTRMRRKLDKG